LFLQQPLRPHSPACEAAVAVAILGATIGDTALGGAFSTASGKTAVTVKPLLFAPPLKPPLVKQLLLLLLRL
jgi:hypothetical protein